MFTACDFPYRTLESFPDLYALFMVCCFILCLTVSADECVLEADYTRRNVYICAIKRAEERGLFSVCE